MSSEREPLEEAIRALEAQRALLGDAVLEMAAAPLRARLAALRSGGASEAETMQTLKQVSILFLDVVGSTALGQQLDAEAVSAVMDDALARGTAIVEAHHGKVLQYAGDNILAAFGADETREDDAERAVRCGLALLKLGRQPENVAPTARAHGGFDVRVGIHTGGVLLGGGVDAEGTIRGNAVNIAARMEQTAPPGALRISHDSYALVRGLFEVQAQPPLAIKGVDTPVISYLVLRAKPRNFRIGTRGIEGVATRMIGRDLELEALQSAFKRLFSERRLAVVTVVADAGVGKSRLLQEFEAWSEARPESYYLFRGRATPQTGAQAFGLLRDIIAWRLQIADDDSVDVARRKMEDGIVPLFLSDDGPELAEAHAHLLGHLIGIEWRDSRHIKGILDDPKQIRNRAFHAAAQVLRRISALGDRPLMLQLEDLHWADGESLDFLNYLLEVSRDVPMLVLATARPTLFERRTAWGAAEGLHQRIDMAPLDKRASRELANELLQKLPDIPAALRELLISSAEGNPFYMEELLKMLIEQGAIQTGNNWSIDAQRLLLTKVPPTLTGVLQARLDGLPATEKRALQQASVVGAVFWDQALAAIDEQAIGQLQALARRELALPRADAALEGLREYAFRHQLLHQVTYDTVLKRHKREGHARVAQWLARLTAQGSLRAGDFLGIAAEHFEQAGDGLNAAEFHGRAAGQAAQRFAHDRVLAHVGRALTLLAEGGPAQAELRWRLLSTRERTLDLQARRDEQAADLATLAGLADALDDDRRRAYCAWRRSNRAMRMADWPGMDAAACLGMTCATRAGDDDLRLHTLRLQASAQVRLGHFQAGREVALRGLEEARSLGLRGVEARLLNVLAIIAEVQGDPVGALELSRQSLLIHRETGDRVNEAIGLCNLGEGWLKLGALQQTRQELEAALQLLRANGDRTVEGSTLASLSTMALWLGEETRALALAHSALDIAEAAQARAVEVQARLRLGDAELALGRSGAARQAYSQARVLAAAIALPFQHDASAGLARVALAAGDIPTAMDALQGVLQWVADGGTLDGSEYPRQVEITSYLALHAAGDPRADAWLQRAHGALMAQATSISDSELRRGFLQNIPQHRETVAAWQRLGAVVPG